MTKTQPVHEVRFGSIKATVWENMIGEGIKYNVTFSRIYKDGQEWKASESFGRDDLLVVAKAADQAHTWICGQRPAKEVAPAQKFTSQSSPAPQRKLDPGPRPGRS
jgi:hypothetical protein